jgi:hypothetical protein
MARCAGTNKKGKPCGSNALSGLEYCGAHQDQNITENNKQKEVTDKNNHRLSKAEKFEKWFQRLIALVTIATPLLVVYVGNTINGNFSKLIKEQESRSSLLNIAIEIVKNKDVDDNLRKWAIETVNRYSEVKMSGEQKESFADYVMKYFQTIALSITVVDESNNPIKGASVSILRHDGYNIYTQVGSVPITDDSGLVEQLIQVSEKGLYVIEVEREGYETYSEAHEFKDSLHQRPISYFTAVMKKK